MEDKRISYGRLSALLMCGIVARRDDFLGRSFEPGGVQTTESRDLTGLSLQSLRLCERHSKGAQLSGAAWDDGLNGGRQTQISRKGAEAQRKHRETLAKTSSLVAATGRARSLR